MKIVWLPFAQEDIDNIFKFIADKSKVSAINVFNDILDEIETLKNFPQVAQIEPLLSSLPTTCRSLLVRKTYKVVYYLEADTIYIASVWDCRQNPDKLRGDVEKRKCM